ncbi:MAG: hypothetical protein LW817_05375 [Candidatus Caenarcaniphilales bacterium]|jgi:F0F1-type ATP synthase assembly protein I|nr:hypothetical protein [Candidatus Caenarcaniphilales bacterium]
MHDLAYTIPATVILFLGLGYFLENNLGIKCMAICVIVGAILGFVLTIYRALKKK